MEKSFFHLQPRYLLWELHSLHPRCSTLPAGTVALPSRVESGHSRRASGYPFLAGSGQATVPQWRKYQGWAQPAQGPLSWSAQLRGASQEGPRACGGGGGAAEVSPPGGVPRLDCSGKGWQGGCAGRGRCPTFPPGPLLARVNTQVWDGCWWGRCTGDRDYEGAGYQAASSPGLRGIKQTWSPTLLPSPALGALPG